VSINIDLPALELALLKQITNLDDDAAAVLRATREFMRMSRICELKKASGNVEVDYDWKKLEDLELAEAAFPQ
jgi:hypothetical protein